MGIELHVAGSLGDAVQDLALPRLIQDGNVVLRFIFCNMSGNVHPLEKERQHLRVDFVDPLPVIGKIHGYFLLKTFLCPAGYR